MGMCFDMGHANLCPTSRHDDLGYLRSLGLHVPIIHVHGHENYGDTDTHLPLFTGPSRDNDSGLRRLLQILRKQRFGGAIILGPWPGPPELLVNARNRLGALDRE